MTKSTNILDLRKHHHQSSVSGNSLLLHYLPITHLIKGLRALQWKEGWSFWIEKQVPAGEVRRSLAYWGGLIRTHEKIPSSLLASFSEHTSKVYTFFTPTLMKAQIPTTLSLEEIQAPFPHRDQGRNVGGRMWWRRRNIKNCGHRLVKVHSKKSHCNSIPDIPKTK